MINSIALRIPTSGEKTAHACDIALLSTANQIKRSSLEYVLIDGIIGVVIDKPEPYQWQTRLRAIIAVVMGLITALFPVAIAASADRNLSLTALLAVYLGSAAVLSFAWRLYFD